MSESDNILMVMEMRRLGVTNTRLMEAVERVPKEAFKEDGFVNQIYNFHEEASTAKGKNINRTTVIAMICDALNIKERMKVLEIGTGSGYQTGILSKLCRRVFSLDENINNIKTAETNLSNLKIRNVTLMKGDLEKGWEAQAPFERIIINKVIYKIPDSIKEQLADGGVLIAPIGWPDSLDQMVKRFKKDGEALIVEDLLPIRFIPLEILSEFGEFSL